MDNREVRIRRITLWGALVNFILTGGKIAAGVMGRSAAMVADGIHSLSDLLSDIVVLIFTHIASKEKDRSHSFGHGKFETMATLIVSVLLMAVGGKLMASGVESIIGTIKGEEIPEPGIIALIAAAASILIKEVLYHMTAKVGKDINSPVVIANAWHHRSDALSSIGSLVGVGGAIILGNRWTILDPIASCCISIAIIFVAVRMALPSLSELLESSLPEDVENKIIESALEVDGVIDIHDLKTRRNGISYIIDAHITVSSALNIIQAHDIANKVEDALRAKFGSETQINIHMEPDLAESRKS
ncbi:MAG: cation transporter [Bacteroidales bacterium]|nr:cation transporter [Bacteroidales bacterium]